MDRETGVSNLPCYNKYGTDNYDDKHYYNVMYYDLNNDRNDGWDNDFTNDIKTYDVMKLQIAT